MCIMTNYGKENEERKGKKKQRKEPFITTTY